MTHPDVAPSLSFNIVREAKVTWFDARQLLATAAKTIEATIVGSMSGRRELMAALEPGLPDIPNYGAADELWLDYIADTGDGWDAVSSIAWLVGRDGIVLSDTGPTPQPIPVDCRTEGLPISAPGQTILPHGEILILGGDEVYPTASSEAYQRRLVDPFVCARSWQSPPRTVFALPGNHDWYDGLTGFLRLFCQTQANQRWIGAWKTRQRRSYFAMKLPHGWWLWGLDAALEDDFDPPQQDYFRERAAALTAADKVIVCVPTPGWLDDISGQPKDDTVRGKLDMIIEMVRGAGCTVPVVLTGDRHYYTRYSAALPEGGQRNYVVCGGGGAFGLGTIQAPAAIELASPNASPLHAKLHKAFPDKAESIALRRNVLWFPLVNRVFSGLLVAIQFVTLWLMNSAAFGVAAGESNCSDVVATSWIGRLACTPPGLETAEGLFYDGMGVVAHGPGLLIWILVCLGGFGAFAASGNPPRAPGWYGWVVGVAHGILQMAAATLCIWLALRFGLLLVGGGASHWVGLLAAVLLTYIVCGGLFGLYLFLGHKILGLHDQEVFSAQGIEGYKCFLRMHVGADGVTIHPIGLVQQARDWRAAKGVTVSKTSRTRALGLAQRVDAPEGCLRIFDPSEPLAPHRIEPAFMVGQAKHP